MKYQLPIACEQGFSGEESKATILRLEKEGVDLIELSGGTYESCTFIVPSHPPKLN
jgi:hypothetical protein